jgi:hypothetical protein
MFGFVNLVGWGVYLVEGGGLPDWSRMLGAEMLAVAIASFLAGLLVDIGKEGM